jgi:predicted ATPase
VATICRRLEGLPLALKLAAARVSLLGLAALLSQLNQALETGGARDLPERQKTMRATLRWSYDLLSEEKILFRRLCVFAGGFSLEAAEAVGVAGEAITDEVLRLLGQLVEQSLVAADTSANSDAELRYRMREPVRQYAQELLEESGETEETRQRHASFFLALAERAELHGPDQVERLEKENDNLGAAMDWALRRRCRDRRTHKLGDISILVATRSPRRGAPVGGGGTAQERPFIGWASEGACGRRRFRSVPR